MNNQCILCATYGFLGINLGGENYKNISQNGGCLGGRFLMGK